MSPEKPVINYVAYASASILSGIEVKLYITGKAEILGVGFDLCQYKDIDGKVLGERTISPKKVASLVSRLVNAGFYNLEDEYSEPFTLDGCQKTISLNYHEKVKNVVYHNNILPSQEVNAVMKELDALYEKY